MALDFPANPTDGQAYGSYVFDGTAGVWKSREESAAVTVVSPTAPLSANPGDLWLNSNNNILFAYYSDDTSSQWVEVVTSNMLDISGKANLSGADFTGSVSSTGVITSTAGPAGIVLKAGPTFDHAYMTFHADSQAQNTRSGYFGYGSVNNSTMSISNEMTNGNLSLLVNGTGQVNLPTKTYMPGAVVQVQEFRGGTEVTTTGSAVTVVTGTFTTKLPGSKLLMIFYSGQMQTNKVDTNPEFFFTVDGAGQGLDTDHIFYNLPAGIRPVVTIPLLTSAISTAGAHTISVLGGSYNGGVIQYNFQSSTGTEPRRSRLTVMEIAQ